MTIQIISDEQKKLSLWSRPSTYVGGPSVVTNRHKSSNTNTNRARSADARCFGFGSGISRFTVIQSSPASPMIEQAPLFWYCKDIDITDGGGGNNNKTETSHTLRKRSRHDCHFAPGTSIPLGKNVFPGHRIFYPYFHFVALP